MAEIALAEAVALYDRGSIWDTARGLWLASLRSDHTRAAYQQALADCLGFCEVQPWEIGRSDMGRWVDDMRRRGLAGTTIAQRVAAVSSYYRYICEECSLMTSDGEMQMHTLNPASGKSLRPKITPYGKARWLDARAARALIGAIDRSTLRGQRDYALILGYLLTGRRNSEWRLARLGDFEMRGKRVFYRWSGKGRDNEAQEIPKPVWDAIAVYLIGAHKANAGADTYLFTPLSDRATRLPGVRAKDWSLERPISSREALRIVKCYARRAGLETEKLTVHTLRHTAAMLRKEVGDTLEDIQGLLVHKSIAITQIYLHRLDGQRDESWGRVSNLLGLGRI